MKIKTWFFLSTVTALIIFGTQAYALQFTTYSPSVYNTDTAVMDASLGLTDMVIEDFEDVNLISGLSVSWGSGAPVTTLGGMIDQDGCEWDGIHALHNQLYSEMSFFYEPGTTVFGIGLSQFEADRQASVSVLVNGNVEIFNIMTDPNFRDADWGYPWRNLYLKIETDPGEIITAVGFDLTPYSTDGVFFDHIAVDPVPEPATMLLLGSGLAGLAGIRRKFKKS